MCRKEGTKNIKRSILEIYVENHPFLKKLDDVTECLVCKSKIQTNCRDGKKRIQAHEKSRYHLDNFQMILNRTESSTHIINADETHKRITRFFVEAGIPLFVLDKKSSKDFFIECFGFTLKCSETYRCRYLPNIVAEERTKVEDAFFNTPFFIKLDETTDVNGRYILNIMGQLLNNSKSRHYLIDTIELERCNCANIISELRFLLPKIIKDKDNRHFFKGLVTDGASYCLRLGKILKEDYPDIKHLICLCHNLHLVAEEIRKRNPLLNEFIAEIKRILVKNKNNRALYFEKTKLPMIRFPIVTRWGTFLQCANFIYENFDLIEIFILNLSSEYTKIKEIIINNRFKLELKVGSEAIFICQAIKYLETDGLSLTDQLATLFTVRNKIFDADLLKRFDEIIENNVDLNYFMNINQNMTPDLEYYHSLNLTTVHVERSFNVLKNVLTERRRSIKSQNLYNYTSIATNTI